MDIVQTVEIPADRRLVIDVPPEVPTGSVILTFTPKVDASKKRELSFIDELLQSGGPLPGGNARTVEEALQNAAKKRSDPNRKSFNGYVGKLSKDAFGDSKEYQKAMRAEWDD